MIEENWVAIIENEDRLIANSDRRFRYHCYSLESMSEELTYQERSLYVENDFTVELLVEDFIDTVQNEKLAVGLRHLTYGSGALLNWLFGRGINTRKLRQYSSAVRRRLRCCFRERFTGSGNI